MGKDMPEKSNFRVLHLAQKEIRKEVLEEISDKVNTFRKAYWELGMDVAKRDFFGEGAQCGAAPKVSIEQYLCSMFSAINSAARYMPAEGITPYLSEMGTHISRVLCDEAFAADSPDSFLRVGDAGYPKKGTNIAFARNFAGYMIKVMQVRDVAFNGNNPLLSHAMHGSNVGEYAEAIGYAMHLDQMDIEILRLAGLLHDGGKLTFTDDMNTRKYLTPEQWQVVYRHPEYSAELVGAVGLSEIGNIVHCHHLRHDRTGYPESAKKHPKNLLAAIVEVADAYDAASRDRTYKNGVGPDGAVEELKKGMSTQFHPLVVAKSVRVLPEMYKRINDRAA